MQDKSANFLSLFASSSTLICCALPSLFIAIGAGASFASLITVFPFLIVLSQYKLSITIFALVTIIFAGYVNYKTYYMPCPTDPELGKLCMQCLFFTSDAADDLLCVGLGGRGMI